MQDRRRGSYESDDRRGRSRSGFDRMNEDWRSRQYDEPRFRGDDRRFPERPRGDVERSWRDQGDGFAGLRDRFEDDRVSGPDTEYPEYPYESGRYNEEFERGAGREYGRSERDFGGWGSQPSGGFRDFWRSGDHQTQAVGPSRTNWGSRFGGYGNEPSYAGRGPKNYQRSDDRIREEVSDRLTDDPRIDASEITVEVKNCEVTLSGTVSDREQKRRAEDMAERITGVRDVNNNIRVSRSPEPDRATTGTSRSSGQAGTGTTRSKSGVEV